MDKRNRKNTVKQHYVPRCYMKNFATNIGNKSFISFYQFSGGILKDDVPTSSICYGKFYYGEDNILEKKFAEKEKEWAIILKKISQTEMYIPNPQEEKSIKDFAVYQLIRTPLFFNYQVQAFEDALTEHLYYNCNLFIDKYSLKKMVHEAGTNQVCAADIIASYENSDYNINDLEVSIVKYETRTALITSDMPVIIMNPYCPQSAGLSMVGLIIFFPVSSDKLVIIYDKKIYTNNKYILSNIEQEAINLNRYQFIISDECLLANRQIDFHTYIKDPELQKERNNYKYRGKTNASYLYKQKRAILMHSHAMDYRYNLSFCRFRKEVNSIPENCKSGCRRQFEMSSRWNLLCDAYMSKELIIKRHGITNKQEYKKIREGYIKIQKFMDNYWDIPMKERTITSAILKSINIYNDNMYNKL